MMGGEAYFVCESHCPGNPNKICDMLSDMVVDLAVERMPDADVRCRVMLSEKLLTICCELDTDRVVADEIRALLPFRVKRLLDEVFVGGNSLADVRRVLDIRVVQPSRERAGGGFSWGFACDETDFLVPMPYLFAHGLAEKYMGFVNRGEVDAGPDAVFRVSMKYNGFVPEEVVGISVDMAGGATGLNDFLMDGLVLETIPSNWRGKGNLLDVRKRRERGVMGVSGVLGPWQGYGDSCHFSDVSGFSPIREERAGAYMARFLAKGVVESGLASRVKVLLDFGAGNGGAADIRLDFCGTGLMGIGESEVGRTLSSGFDLTASGIFSYLGLGRANSMSAGRHRLFGGRGDESQWEGGGAAKFLEGRLNI